MLARLLVGWVRIPSFRVRERRELKDAHTLDTRTLEYLEGRAKAHERLYVVDGRELGSGIGVDLDLFGVASADAREDYVGCRIRISTGVGGGGRLFYSFSEDAGATSWAPTWHFKTRHGRRLLESGWKARINGWTCFKRR